MYRRRKKTFLMRLIEHRYQECPIEQIMIEAYRSHGTERGAAEALGITQQVFNTWKFRLGIEEDILPYRYGGRDE